MDDVAYDIISLFCAEKLTRDEIVQNIAAEYPEITEEEIFEIFEDIDELEEAGKIFAPDIYEPRAYDLKNRHTEIKALCLHVAHTCNLDCSYCFAAQGKFNGERGLMSLATGKRALDFLIENSGLITALAKRKDLNEFESSSSTSRRSFLFFLLASAVMSPEFLEQAVAFPKEQVSVVTKKFLRMLLSTFYT